MRRDHGLARAELAAAEVTPCQRRRGGGGQKFAASTARSCGLGQFCEI